MPASRTPLTQRLFRALVAEEAVDVRLEIAGVLGIDLRDHVETDERLAVIS